MLDFEHFYSYNKQFTSERRQSIKDEDSIFSSGCEIKSDEKVKIYPMWVQK